MRKEAIDLTTFVDRVEKARPPAAPVLVALGGWGVVDCDRVGVIAVEAEATVLVDAYLPRVDVTKLLDKLAGAGPARLGAWDTMHATAWQWAWTTDDGPFHVYDHEGLRVSVGPSEVNIRGKSAVRRQQVKTVCAYVSHDMVLRGVWLNLVDAETCEIASVKDRVALVDPTFDEQDLDFEIAWAVDLATTLASVLEVPYRYES